MQDAEGGRGADREKVRSNPPFLPDLRPSWLARLPQVVLALHDARASPGVANRRGRRTWRRATGAAGQRTPPTARSSARALSPRSGAAGQHCVVGWGWEDDDGAAMP
ncbi:hypothetical protein ZWY2020_059525 [Hordeum vulgare]|nr:hypothetical protein ZWY2020_059525 [Hordeum vulgare]